MGASRSLLPHSQRGALTLTDAAAYLSIGEHEFKRLINAGEIPLVTWLTAKQTEMRRVRVRDLDAFLARHLDDAPMSDASS